MGHRLVSGDLKDARVVAWLAELERDSSALLFCARGEQRSQIAAQWIHDAGGSVQRIEGGFKAMRNQMLPLLAPDPSTIAILGGSTGVGKTVVIQSDENAIDLEGYANHRGSAFGAHLSGQPSQIDLRTRLRSNSSSSNLSARAMRVRTLRFWKTRVA